MYRRGEAWSMHQVAVVGRTGLMRSNAHTHTHHRSIEQRDAATAEQLTYEHVLSAVASLLPEALAQRATAATVEALGRYLGTWTPNAKVRVRVYKQDGVVRPLNNGTLAPHATALTPDLSSVVAGDAVNQAHHNGA